MKASPGADQRLLGRPEFSGGRPSHRRWRDAPDAAHPAAAIDQKPRQLMAPHQVITENEQAILVRRKQSSASCGRRSPADHLTLKAYEQAELKELWAKSLMKPWKGQAIGTMRKPISFMQIGRPGDEAAAISMTRRLPA